MCVKLVIPSSITKKLAFSTKPVPLVSHHKAEANSPPHLFIKAIL
jgi:hypothetical protein